MKHLTFDSMFQFQFHVNVVEYRNDGVWVATSDEIKGLTVEEASLEACLATLIDVGAELLAHNHGLTEEQIANTALHTHVVHHLGHAEAGPRPNLIYSDAAAA